MLTWDTCERLLPTLQCGKFRDNDDYLKSPPTFLYSGSWSSCAVIKSLSQWAPWTLLLASLTCQGPTSEAVFLQSRAKLGILVQMIHWGDTAAETCKGGREGGKYKEGKEVRRDGNTAELQPDRGGTREFLDSGAWAFILPFQSVIDLWLSLCIGIITPRHC